MAIHTRQFNFKQKIGFWKNHFALWKKSKLSQAEYCRQNNLNKCLFSKWKIKLEGETDPSAFVELPIKNIAKESSNNLIHLIINDSIKIKLEGNYDETLLMKILKAIGVSS